MTTPTLPQRVPGAHVPDEERTAAAEPPARENCHLCRNGHDCDWHQWVPRHPLGDGECECCFGRYATCQNTTKETEK